MIKNKKRMEKINKVKLSTNKILEAFCYLKKCQDQNKTFFNSKNILYK